MSTATLTPISIPIQLKAVLPILGGERVMRFAVLDDSWIKRFDWDSWEVYELQFDISPGAIDASRFGKAGDGSDSVVMFTDGHNDDRRIGKAIAWDIEDGKLYFTVKVGSSEWAQRYIQEISDGVEPGKSIEVFVQQTEEMEPAEYEDTGDRWYRKMIRPAKRRATKYQLSAISTVTTPAIGTIGFSTEEIDKFAGMGQQILQLQLQVEEMKQKLNATPLASTEVEVTVTETENLEVQSRSEEEQTAAQPSPVVLDSTPSQPSVPVPPPTPSVSPAELQAANARIEVLEAELAQQRTEKRQAGIEKFLADNSPRLVPAMRDFTATVKSESGDRQVNLTAFLASLPDPMLHWFQAWVKECFHAQIPTRPVIPPGEFSTQTGSALSPKQLADLAKKYHAKMMAEGTPVTYSEALDRVMSENGIAV